MKTLLTLLPLLVSAPAVAAGVLINGNQINPTSNITIASMTVNGAVGAAGIIKGVGGYIFGENSSVYVNTTNVGTNLNQVQISGNGFYPLLPGYSFTSAYLNDAANGFVPYSIIASSFAFGSYTAQSFPFVINANGYVGIGTNSPSSTLSINGSGANYGNGLRILDGFGNYYEEIYDGANGFTIGRNAVDKLVISRGGNSWFTSSSGNLGVGTTTPQTNLDVQGNAQFGSTAKSTFTASGVLQLASSLGVAYGGLGVANPTAHAVILGEGSSATSDTGAGTSGQCLTSSGAGVDPSWGACAAGVSGGVSGNYTKWTGTNSLGNSFAAETSTGVTISSNVAVNGYLDIRSTGGGDALGNALTITTSGGLSEPLSISKNGNVCIEGPCSSSQAIDVAGSIQVDTDIIMTGGNNHLLNFAFVFSSSNQACNTTCGVSGVCLAAFTSGNVASTCSASATNQRCLCVASPG